MTKEKEMSEAGKPDKADETGKDSMVLTAFQTACLAIIVLNAKLIGDLLYDFLLGQLLAPRLLGLLIFASILNFFELANNWASIKKYFSLYNSLLFSIDVMTLGFFFWQVYILSRLVDVKLNEEDLTPIGLEQKMVLVLIVSYGLIFILYAIWNVVILRRNKKGNGSIDDKNMILFSAWERFVQAYILFGSIPLAAENNFIYYLHILVLLCILYVLARNRDLKIFDTIIKARGQN